jgi:HlyD family secretion protein
VSQVRLQPVTEQNVVSYVTIIDVPNPGQKLKPGMTATVSLEIARAEDVVRVPSAALRFRPSRDGARVWVVGADGEPTPVTVRVGVSDGATTALLDGDVAAGARVVTSAAVQGAATPAATAGSPLIPRRPARQGGAR